MKRIVVLASVLSTLAAVIAFASGTGEYDNSTTPYGRQDTVTVTGELDIRDGFFPALRDGAQIWELMVHYVPDGLKVESGQTITVSGFEMPRRRWRTTGDIRALMVETARVDGKEYVLPAGPGSMMGYGGYGGMMGGRGGMMGGWGNRGGASYGPGYGCWGAGTQAGYGDSNQRTWR